MEALMGAFIAIVSVFVLSLLMTVSAWSGSYHPKTRDAEELLRYRIKQVLVVSIVAVIVTGILLFFATIFALTLHEIWTFGAVGSLSVLFVTELVYIAKSIRIVPQYEQRVAMAFGRYWSTWDTGFHFAPWPFVHSPSELRVSTKEILVDVFPNGLPVEIENALVVLQAIITVRVVNAEKLIFSTEGGGDVVLNDLAPAEVRDALQTVLADKKLSWVRSAKGENLAYEISPSIEAAFDSWGLELIRFIISDVEEPSKVTEARIRRFELQMFDEAAWAVAKHSLAITKGDNELTEDDREKIRVELPNARGQVLQLEAMYSLRGMKIVARPGDMMALAGMASSQD